MRWIASLWFGAGCAHTALVFGVGGFNRTTVYTVIGLWIEDVFFATIQMCQVYRAGVEHRKRMAALRQL
jgi:hypothetical protein